MVHIRLIRPRLSVATALLCADLVAWATTLSQLARIYGA
jgi:hypothetical protein